MSFSVPQSNPTVSFCTACHNRAHQFKQTFQANLMTVARSSDLEWIILNYCSEDDLHAFMTEQLGGLPPQVIYVHLTERRPWHLSAAKNLAHRYGRGRILANIDCDNFIGEAADLLPLKYWEGCKLVHLWSGVFRDGTCGRVAVERTLFYALGGYDESLFPMGYQDRDLVARAVALGARYFRLPCATGTAILNTKDESIRHCGPGADWEKFDRENQAASIRNIRAGYLRAKSAQNWSPLHLVAQRGGGGKR